MEQIAHCPFCNGVAEIVVDRVYSPYGYESNPHNETYVRCTNVACGATGPRVVIEHFNRFSKHTVQEFRENNALRAREEERYEEYQKAARFQALAGWNRRENLTVDGIYIIERPSE